MNWKERAATFLNQKSPPSHTDKTDKSTFSQFSQYGAAPFSGNKKLLATPANDTPEAAEPTYHGFTLAELEAEAADDWYEIQNDSAQLEAFAHALRTTETRQQGERPDHYTKAVECAVCGPVWLWEDAPDNVQGCPWCMNSGPVPRAGPVLCRDCSHWVADTINPAGGLGKCGKNVPGLAWPWRKLGCSQYRTALLPSVV